MYGDLSLADNDLIFTNPTGGVRLRSHASAVNRLEVRKGDGGANGMLGVGPIYCGNSIVMTEGKTVDGVDVSEIRTPKELIVPVSDGVSSGDAGYHRGVLLDPGGPPYGIEFWAPEDFSSITLAYLVGVPMNAEGTFRLTVHTCYGTVGEAYNAHAGAITDQLYDGVQNQLFDVDISTTLASLAAGDRVGLEANSPSGTGQGGFFLIYAHLLYT